MPPVNYSSHPAVALADYSSHRAQAHAYDEPPTDATSAEPEQVMNGKQAIENNTDTSSNHDVCEEAVTSSSSERPLSVQVSAVMAVHAPPSEKHLLTSQQKEQQVMQSFEMEEVSLALRCVLLLCVYKILRNRVYC